MVVGFSPSPSLRGNQTSSQQIGSNQPHLCSRRSFLTWVLSGFSLPQLTEAASRPRRNSKEIESAVKVEWPAVFPFEKEDFRRFDETSDFNFYDEPKLVYHIDVPAQKALADYYASFIAKNYVNGTPDVLDLCSSWVSYLPKRFNGDSSLSRVAGVGINEEELRRNPQLTDFVVIDLNSNPALKYDADSFDLVLCALSIDYLTQPLLVLREVRRVLRPGGTCIISFSNRLFSTKAVAHWTGSGDVDHVYAVGSYYHFAGGFSNPVAEDISPKGSDGDPLYIVRATKI